MPEYVRLQSVSGNLQTPSGVAIDAYDNLYVADSKSNKLIIYSSDGAYIDAISGLNEPISVAVGNGRIYVGNSGNGEVKIYDMNNNYISSITGLSKPTSIEVDSAGKVYIVDAEKDIVNVYNSDGSFGFSFGGSGNADGQFHFPTAIAINNVAGEIVVSDLQITSSWMGVYEGARVQVFDMNGNHKRSFGTYGIGADKLFRPSGVAVDEEGRVYVTDVFQNVVQVYDNAGSHIGSIYDPVDPMRTPVDVKISSSNKLYVASFYTYSVEVYRITDDKPAYAAVVPQSHNFGNTYVGSTSSAQSFKVHNIGSGDLQLGSVEIAGADAADFIVQADSCYGSSLAPAATCEVTVVMSPLSEAAKGAQIFISSNDPDSPLVVTISGAGVAAPNQAPVANAGGPYVVAEGSTAMLDASASSDADGNVVSYAWDLDNDGAYETVGNPMGFDATSIDGPVGPYTIGLQVTDNFGATDTTTTTISVSNVPPAADAGGPYIGVTGAAVYLYGSAVDAGAADVLAYEWDLDGDGTYETFGKDAQVTYGAIGNYTIGLKVTDDDGGVGIDTAQVSINAVVVEKHIVNVNLKAGWNLIGWVSDIGYYKKGAEPQQGQYASGAEMVQVANLADAMTEIGLASTEYLAVIGPKGQVFVPGSRYNTLKTLLPDSAYWIYVNQGITITLPGEMLPLSATSTLSPGWAQVGYRGEEGLAPSDALRCVEGNYYLVVSGDGSVYDSGLLPGKITNKILKNLSNSQRGRLAIQGELDSMHQGQGYYIYMITDSTLTYDCP